MALDKSGYVWVWGWNGHGELGIGTEPPHSGEFYYGGMKRIPYFSNSGITIKEIQSNYHNRLALTTAGDVYAWGHNGYGQAANGTTSVGNAAPQAPIKVNGLPPIERIFSNNAEIMGFNFALATDGTLWAWGYNAYGQLGLGTTNTAVTSVQQVNLPAEMGAIVDIAAGDRHTIILDDNGEIWLAGSTYQGRLGDGRTTDGTGATATQRTFAKLDRASNGIGKVISVSACYGRSGIVDEAHKAYEWGATFGETAASGAITVKSTPRPIGFSASEVASIGYTPVPQRIVAGESVSYVIDQHGRTWAWGDGRYYAFGNEGGNIPHYTAQRVKAEAAEQWPKVIGDGDTQSYDYSPKTPVYMGGTKTANTTYFGYGIDPLHPTIYDEKYMLKNSDGNVVDEAGNPLRYATSATMNGVSGLTVGKYYRSAGGSANAITAPATEGMPAVDPDEWTWIRLGLQPMPFVSEMYVSRSAYTILDADGNIYKWGYDGSGSIAWGWDKDKYDQDGDLVRGLYNRYTYEVMYMRGAPTIDNISIGARIEKKVYTEAGQDATNPVTVNVHIPASSFNEALGSNVYSDLNELKYVFVPYDTSDPNFNVDAGTLTEAEFMAIYNNAAYTVKGELLDAPLQSTSTVQDLSYTVNAPQNGRLIVYGANERYVSNDGGVTREYSNKDPLFSVVLADNVYTKTDIHHKGEGENPSGTTEEVYAATNDTVSKLNDDSAHTGEALDTTLYGLPLDANGATIGTSTEPPTYGYDRVGIKSYESAGYPSGSSITNYWQWKDQIEDPPGTTITQPKELELSLDDDTYAAGHVHPFQYEPNANWTEVDGTKTWDDDSDKFGFRPDSIELTLKQYERDTATGAKGAFIQDVKTITVSAPGGGGNSWPFDFGTSFKSYEYTYEVVETPISFYTTEVVYTNIPDPVPSPVPSNENFTGIVITNTLDLKPVKFNKVDSSKDPVTSDIATFVLTNAASGGKVFDAAGAEQDSVTLSTSSSSPFVAMPIQKPGTYHLTETKAPGGYNLLTMPIEVTIAADGTVTAKLGSIDLEEVALSGAEADQYAKAFNVVNKTASELPKAGGIGTMLLTILSTAVLVMAAFLLHRRNRIAKGATAS